MTLRQFSICCRGIAVGLSLSVAARHDDYMPTAIAVLIIISLVISIAGKDHDTMVLIVERGPHNRKP